MKKNLLLVTGAITLGAMLSGCSFVVPKKYKVVTKAEYNFTLAKMKKDLGSMINFDEMFSSEDTDSKMKMYQYNPGGESTIKQYVIEMPVGDSIELDMTSYIQDDLYKGEPVKFEQEFEMPVVDFVEEKEISITDISDYMNSMVRIMGFVPETKSLTVSSVPETAGDSFESITYESGIMKVYLEAAINGSSYVTIEKMDGTVIAGPAVFNSCRPVRKSVEAGDFSEERTMEYCAEIDLAGKSIYMSNIKIKFSSDVPFNKNSFFAEVENTSENTSVVKSAQGVNVSNYAVSLSSETVNLDLGESIKTFTIEDGKLFASVQKPVDEDGNDLWSGVTVDFGYITTGDLTVYSGEEGKADLHNKTLSHNSSFIITPDASLKLVDATVDLTKPLKLKYGIDIVQIQSVTVDTTKLNKDDFGNYAPIETQQEKSEPLSDDVTDMIKEIWFDKSNFEVKYTNSLPRENEIGLKMKSDFLNINEEISLLPGKTDEDASFTTDEDDISNPGKKTKKEDDSNASVDFVADVVLPGYNDADKTCVLKYVTPSKNGAEPQKYKIAVEVIPHIEWIQATADLSNQDLNKADTMDTGIALGGIMSMLGEDFCNNVTMNSIPVYIFSEKPNVDAFDSVTIGGNIIVTGADGKTVSLLEDGKNRKGEPMNLSAGCPDLKLDEEKKTASVDFTKVITACDADIASVVSFSSQDSLKIDYDIGISGIDGGSNVTLKKSEMGEKTSLKITAYIVLPLTFKVIRPTDMDMMKFIGGGDEGGEPKDLLGRSEEPEESAALNFLDAVESFTIFIKSSNVPFEYAKEGLNGNRSVQFILDLNANEYEDGKELSLEDGNYSLSGAEIKNAINTFPYVPSVKIRFPAGQMSIKKDMTLKSRIDFQLKTDGSFTIEGLPVGNNE